jgi:hypothetical protein
MARIFLLHAVEYHRALQRSLVAKCNLNIFRRQLGQLAPHRPPFGFGQLRQLPQNFSRAHAKNLPPMNDTGKPGGSAPGEPDDGKQNLVANIQSVVFFRYRGTTFGHFLKSKGVCRLNFVINRLPPLVAPAMTPSLGNLPQRILVELTFIS